MRKLIVGVALAALLVTAGYAANDFIPRKNNSSAQWGLNASGEVRVQKMTDDNKAMVESTPDTTTAAAFVSIDAGIAQIDWRLNTGTGHAKDISDKVSTEAKQDVQEITLDALEVLQTAANALLTTLAGLDYATETTLTAQSTAALQTAANALLTTLSTIDFATETTLVAQAAAQATSALQTAANALLTTIAGLDFATETTQTAQATAALQTAANALFVTIDSTLTTIAGLDFATETTLAAQSAAQATAALQTAANALLTTIAGLDFSTETTLAAMSAAQATSALQTAANALLTAIDLDTSDIKTAIEGTGASAQEMQGSGTIGLALTGKPFVTAGTDSGGAVRDIWADSSGRQSFFGLDAAADNISGTFLAKASTPSGSQGYVGVFNFMQDPADNRWDRFQGTIAGGLFSQGSSADGAADTGNPNVGAGVDGSSNVQTWLSDTDGHQQVDVLTLPLAVDAATETSLAAVELNTDTGANISHKAHTVTASATEILSSSVTTRRVTIINAFTDLVAIGSSGSMTINTNLATDGFVLAASNAANDGSGGSLTIETTAPIWGIGASANSKVIIIVESD